ncbi:hypothetical protein GCM10010384_59950 [Streptomyces djakartensis]|uniref:Uncharacterized protein n=1 Tax=Streptomyces djakartensis TaxID=68193 RepID=A0ABQ3AEC1_9ACTN|nr:hypothetical protein GCM10010384_59950 [Streptomyces djakartensis]
MRTGGQADAPQQQSAQQAAQRDVDVETAGAGESYGHGPIQHGRRSRRVILGEGPRLHPSMYRGFVSRDDDSGRAAREPEEVTERSEP